MKHKSKGLTKVKIYFWEGIGELKPSNSKFRLEMDINGERNFVVGNTSTINKNLRRLEKLHKVKFPKVSWKGICGDDNGGDTYEWTKQ